MRQQDSGKGRGKAIFATAVLLFAVYAGVKILPVYIHNYELHDYIHELAIRATVERSSEDAVRRAVVEYANSLDLPVKNDNVKVTVGGRVTINLDYSVPIDLKVYTLVLHFTPSAENRQLT